MNDAFLFDDDLSSGSDEALTIRLGRTGDAQEIDRLSELDDCEPGAGPHLVADEGGEIVATLSLSDGTVLGHPFRRTADAVGLLRLRAAQMSVVCPGRRGRTVPRIARLAGSLAALVALTAALAATAVAAPTAPKPGFLPGKWQVVGTISGTSSDGPLTTVFSGKMRFTLTVAKNLSVGGSGTWAMTMKGSGPVASTMNGTAAVKLSGTAVDVRFGGQQNVTGTVSDGTLSTPIRMSRPLNGRLVIKRAGQCRVTGTSPMGPGATLTWTALLAGSGTCNA